MTLYGGTRRVVVSSFSLGLVVTIVSGKAGSALTGKLLGMKLHPFIYFSIGRVGKPRNYWVGGEPGASVVDETELGGGLLQMLTIPSARGVRSFTNSNPQQRCQKLSSRRRPDAQVPALK